MAILQKIRNKSVFLLVIVGVALMAFIVGDALQNGTSYFNSSKNQVAEINGEPISIKEYRDLLNHNIELIKNSKNISSLPPDVIDQIEIKTWAELINKNLFEKEFEKIGVTITDKEIAFLINSTQDRLVQQFFEGATKQQIASWVANLGSQNSTIRDFAHWQLFKKSIREEKSQLKYFSMINTGIKYSKAFINQFSDLSNKRVAIQYITKSYATLKDDLIPIDDKEIEQYYNNYRENYKQKEDVRKIEYVEFPVIPSEEDYEETFKKMENYKASLSAEKVNYKRFIKRFSDKPYDDNFYTKDQIEDEEIADFAFTEKVNEVYGPELKDDQYILVKLIDKKRLPDSVRVRHILIDDKGKTLEEAVQLADSLENLLKKRKAKFSVLAREFSADNNSAVNGGDLGWIGPFEMVKAFSDTVFNAKRWKVKRVITQFGIHLVQVTRRSRLVNKVQLATVQVRVTPSQETHEKVWAEASRFIGKVNSYNDFETLCKQEKKNPISSTVTKSMKEIAGLTNSNEIIKQTFRTTKPLSLLKSFSNSPIFELDEKYIIAYLTEINNKGYIPLEKLHEKIVVELKRKKKFKLIQEEFNNTLASSNTIEEIAEKTGLQIHDAIDIRFSSNYVNGLGFEPAVTTTSLMLEEGTISEPVKGNNGVYIIQVNTSQEISDEVDYVDENIKKRFNRNLQFEYFNIFETLVDNTEIVDNRHNF